MTITMMSRPCKALPLALASVLVALCIFATGCGSSGNAQVRFVHAIQDSGPIDVEVNGTVKFADLSFLGVSPSQPGYTQVPAGGDTIEGLAAGTTTQAFTITTNLSSGTQYTMVATGFSKTGANGSNVVLLSKTDNNTAPPSGDFSIRVINASPSGPTGSGGAVDVYIEANPNGGVGLPIAIPSLDYQQASNYIPLTVNTNGLGYQVYVTAAGSMIPIINQPINPAAGAVRTLVLTDAQNGNLISPSFLELSDLN
jgi:hypothetical protein